MDIVLEKFIHPRLNQEEMEIMNKAITSTEIKTVMKNVPQIPQNKSPGPDSFTGEFSQTFRDELMPILLKLFQKSEEEGILLNMFYEATITCIPKPNRDITQKASYWPVSLMNIDARINKILANRINNTLK